MHHPFRFAEVLLALEPFGAFAPGQRFRRLALDQRQVRRVRLHPREPVILPRPAFHQRLALAQLLSSRRQRPLRPHAEVNGERRERFRALFRLLFKC